MKFTSFGINRLFGAACASALLAASAATSSAKQAPKQAPKAAPPAAAPAAAPAVVKVEAPVVPEATFPTLLALDESSVWTFKVANSQVKVKGDVVVDSTNQGALWVADGSVRVTDGTLSVAGGYSKLGRNTMVPAPGIGGRTEADPLPEFRVAAPDRVVSQQQLFLNTDPGEDTVLPPGVYVGGIFASGKGHITLQPGTYVIANGDFTAIGPTVEGTGVTIVMGGDQAGSLGFSLGARLLASAPTSGQLKGIVMLSRASSRDHKSISFSVASARLSGLIYAPEASVDFASGADVQAGRIVCLSCSVTGSKLDLTGSLAPADGTVELPDAPAAGQ